MEFLQRLCKHLLCVILCFVVIGSAHLRRRIPKRMRAKNQGPNVCVVQEVFNTRQRFYTECMEYKYSRVCGRPTFLRFSCCGGYTKINGEKGCTGVQPLENLVDTARSMFLRRFTSHAYKAGLIDELSEKGAYTVFVPENEAFRGLDQKLTSHLLPGQSSKEPSLLKYHMIPGRYNFTKFKRDEEFTTLYQDKKLRVNKYANGITTVNCARIVTPNHVATNGIIHVIDQVIEPFDEKGNMLEVLLNDGRFSEFVAALIMTGVANKLRDESMHYTLFAPTDDVFEKMEAGFIEKHNNEDGLKILKTIVNHHLLKTYLCSESIYTRCGFRSVQGTILKADCDKKGLLIGGARVVDKDLMASNGVIHTLDKLLIPELAMDAVDCAKELKLHTFMNMTNDAGYMAAFRHPRETFTVFAPSDQAFKDLPDNYMSLLKSQPLALASVLKYHVVKGQKLMSDSFVSQTSLQTENREKLRVNVYRDAVTLDDAKIVSPDNEFVNGVIHVIDKVLLPPDSPLIDMIAADPELSTFYSAIETAGLTRILTEDGTFTMFAPINDAFDYMDRRELENLLVHPLTLSKVLKRHMISRVIVNIGLVPEATYSIHSMQGEMLNIKKSSEGHISLGSDTEVKVIKGMATNGVLYKVNNVLECDSC